MHQEQLIFYGQYAGVDNLYVKKKIQDINHAFEILKHLRMSHWKIYSAYYINPHRVSFKIPLYKAIEYEFI